MSGIRNLADNVSSISSNVQSQIDLKAPLASPSLTSPALTSPVTIDGNNTSPFTGLKNYIINGGFDIWQRGTSFDNPAIIYTADRFRCYSGGTAGSASQVTLSQNELSGVKYGLNLTRTAGGSNYSEIMHKVEDASKLLGKTLTLSVQTKGSVINASGFEIWIAIFNDSGGVDSWIFTGGGIPVNIGSTFRNTTKTFTLPSSSTGALGSNGGYLGIFYRCVSTTENFNITTAKWQLEQGTVATPFEQRPFGLELSLCQRYYEKSCEYSVVPAAGLGDRRLPAGASDVHYFNTVKRVSPTLTLYRALGSGNALDYYNGGWGQTTGVDANTKSWNVGFSNNSYFIMSGIWTADAEL